MSAMVDSAQHGISSSKSTNDYSSLIRLKERELHEIHDLRVKQLEKVIEEKEGVLMNAQGRFEQLKEDFRYNLTLLEARDQEIDRLEKTLTATNQQLLDCDTERRSLVGRVELLELREVDRVERFKQDQLNSKRILQELKDVIESMRWAAAEEGKTKQREIDNLKEELIRATNSREESLESQRRDLTHTFEQLLSQREATFLSRERDIGGQVISLDSKFEQLSTDNSRLKADVAEGVRRIEHLTEEIALKEEAIRHLQWRLEDERIGRQQADDSLQRRLQQATLELSTCKDLAGKDMNEIQARLDKAVSDAAREKDFRLLVEKRLDESRGSLQQSIALLEAELTECRKREMIQLSELDKIREERDAALERGLMVRLEADSASSRALVLEKACSQSRAEAAESKSQLEQALAKVGNLEKLLADHADDQVGLLAAARISTRQQVRDELRDQANAEATSFRDQIAATERSAAEKQVEIDRLTALLAEEQEESAALRLRLKLLSSQLISGPNSNHSSQYNHASSLGGRGYMQNAHPDAAPTPHMGRDPRRSADLASPVFSEDFGPVSLPVSPDNPHRGRGADENPAYGRNFAFALTSQEFERTGSSGAAVEENERLKKIIREMRADIESLQAQVLESSFANDNGKGGNNAGGTNSASGTAAMSDNSSELEERLQAAMSEVARLRTERRTLLDVSNELRAEINRMRQVRDPTPRPTHPPPPLPQPEPMQYQASQPSQEPWNFDAAAASTTAPPQTQRVPQRKPVKAWTDEDFEP